jgi:hypothetical protein
VRKVHVAVLAAVATLAVAPWPIWWSSLPTEMASHWALTGRANNHMARPLLFVLLAGLTTLLAGFAAGASRHGSALPRALSAGPGLTFAAGLTSVISFGAVYTQRDVESWQAVRMPFGWVAAAFAVGVLVATLATLSLPEEDAAIASRPAVRVGQSETVAWVGSARAPWALALSLLLVAGGAVLLATANPGGGAAVIASGLLVSCFSSTHVVAGKAGVRIRGALAWPSIAIPLSRIESAESMAVAPVEWGGWGYRGSLRFFKRAAWLVRKGEALKLNLRNRAGANVVFIVTVDDSDAAAAVVNGMLGTSRTHVAG